MRAFCQQLKNNGSYQGHSSRQKVAGIPWQLKGCVFPAMQYCWTPACALVVTQTSSCYISSAIHLLMHLARWETVGGQLDRNKHTAGNCKGCKKKTLPFVFRIRLTFLHEITACLMPSSHYLGAHVEMEKTGKTRTRCQEKSTWLGFYVCIPLSVVFSYIFKGLLKLYILIVGFHNVYISASSPINKY